MSSEKIKIMVLCDDPRAPTGVGTQADLLIRGLLDNYPGKYCFRVFGGAIKHKDYSVVGMAPYNEDYIVAPVNGFGDKPRLRSALAEQKPNILMLFTDPRFFIWTWEMEDEIHDICPIAYNHLWDEVPAPDFNKVLYESTDQINCINKLTYNFVNNWFPERTEYVPHALDKNIYKKLSPLECKNHRKALFGDKADWFVGLFVSRNARRKMLGNLLTSWKMFLEKMEKEVGHKKAFLVAHCNPLDPEGANLFKTLEMLDLTEHVYLSTNILPPDKMNVLYNIQDVNFLVSCNEGFGLSILHSLYAGKPSIGVKTGGIQDQIIDQETGEQYGICLEPDVTSLIGSQVVPFINEQYVSHKSISDATWEVYNWGAEMRATIGQKGYEYAMRTFSQERLILSWDRTLTNLHNKWKTEKRLRYNMKTI